MFLCRDSQSDKKKEKKDQDPPKDELQVS